jgi:plasmid maintenance system antidote protein VapI
MRPAVGDASKKFGLEISKALRSRHMMEADLVRSMARVGNAISRQYVNMIVHNERTPPPDMVEKLADAIGLAHAERMVLHRAAALDSGYRIGMLRAS